MIDLTSLYSELESMIDSSLRELAEVPPSELGPLCEELCVFFRTAGIGALLLELDVNQFYHMLIRSGLTRVFLLQQTAPEEKELSRFCKITKANGFFDSVAANRFDVAEKIAVLSPQKWMERYEYEDDYCYILFLHNMIRGGEKSLKEKIVNQFEKILEGESSPKYDVCYALFKQDNQYFDDAFSGLINLWTDEIVFQKKSISRNEIEFAAARHVYVEGLALLRIAEIVGIETQDEYQYCPKEARLPMHTPFPNTGFPM